MATDDTTREQVRQLHRLADRAVADRDLATAERHLEAAFELLREAGGTMPIELAVNRNRWGKIHFRCERPRPARALLAEALTLYRQEHGEQHPIVAAGLQDLAIVEEAIGAYDTAERYYQQAVAIFSRFPEHRQRLATVLSNLAELYLTRGRLAESERFQKRALALKRTAYGEDTPQVANSLHNLGGVVLARGRCAEALELARQAEAIRERQLPPEHPERIAGQELIGECHLAAGRYRSAERAFRRALALRERVFGSDSPNVCLSLHALGNLYRLIGDLDRAEAIYSRALKLKRDQLGEDHADVALCLHNLANVHVWQGRLEDAARGYRRALDIWSSAFGEDHEKVSYAAHSLADVYRHQGRFDLAVPLLVTTLRSMRRKLGKNHPNVYRTVLSLAECSLAGGDLRRADRLLQRVLAKWRETLGERHPDVVRVTARRAQVLAARDRLDAALALLDPLHEIDTALLSEVFSFTTDHQRLLFLEQTRKRLETHLSISFLILARGTAAEQRVRRLRAFELALRRKALSTEALLALHEAIRAEPQNGSGERLERWRALSSEFVRQAWAGAADADCDAMLRELHALEQELARSLPAMALYQVLAEATSPAITAAMPPRSLLLEFAVVRFEHGPEDLSADGPSARSSELDRRGAGAVTGASYCVFVVSSQDRDPVRWLDLGPCEPIHRALEEWLKRLRSLPMRSREVAKRRRRQGRPAARHDSLEALLIRPLEPFLTAGQHLFISPDGELHKLPFGALWWSDGRQLIDDFDISYLSSGRDLLSLDRRPDPSAASSPLVVADPDFDLGMATSQSEGRSPGETPSAAPLSTLYFRPLPGARLEGLAVAETLGARLWTRGEALKRALKSLDSPRILHFATHGFFLTNPLLKHTEDLSHAVPHPGDRTVWSQPLLRTGLALAGANGLGRGFTPPDDAEDGLLTAMDVAGIDLANTGLVTLSACDSGLGESHPGEVALGLRRAFLVAGARTLVVSLWQVPDLPTALLMERFYALLSSGESCHRALRRAQLELRELTVGEIRHRLSELPSGDALLGGSEMNTISGRGEDYHPFRPAIYWAAFICQGDPSPLSESAVEDY